MNDDVLIEVDKVSKKFCRTLKRSLWYGVQDVVGEALGRAGERDKLRSDEFWSVKDVSFELRRGECLGLIGPNGAGKSTLLKMLNGLIKPDRGSITICGRVGALIELGAGFNPILTGRENVYINGAVMGLSREEIDKKFDAIVDFAEIGDFLNTPVQNYSSGMKVRLGFAVAAQLEPDVLLIDEVLAVGDAGFRAKCYNVIQKIQEQSAIIFVSHNMNSIYRSCGNVICLNKGNANIYENVSDGITSYFEICKSKDKVDETILDLDVVKIDNINLQGFDLDKKVMVGERLELCFDVEFVDKPKNIDIFISFLSINNEPVAFATNSSENIVYDSKINHVRFVVRKTPLPPGSYSLSIVVVDQKDKKQYLWIQGVAPFEVVGVNHHRAGTVVLGNWEIS